MEELMFRQMFVRQMFGGGAGRIWLEVAFILGMFGVLIFRPDRIRSKGAFKAAFWLYALSTIVPSLVMVYAETTLVGGMSALFSESFSQSGRSSGQDFEMTVIVLNLLKIASPVLFGISIICCFSSMIPGFVPPSMSPPPPSRPSEPSSSGPASG